MEVLQGKIKVNLENRSTTTKMQSLPSLVQGSWVIKSIETISNGLEGIRLGVNNP